MKTISQDKLMQYVDGTLSYDEQQEVEQLLTLSDEARREIALYRSLYIAAKKQEFIMPSNTFVNDVMTRVMPNANESWLFTILRNSSNVFAMIVVLSSIAFFLLNGASAQKQPEQSALAQQVRTIVEAYDTAVRSIPFPTIHFVSSVSNYTNHITGKIFWIGIGTFLFLVGIDKLRERFDFRVRIK